MKSKRLPFEFQIATSHPHGSRRARRQLSVQAGPFLDARPADWKTSLGSVDLVLNPSPVRTVDSQAVSSPDESRIPSAVPCIPGLDIAAGALLGTASNGAGPGGDFLDVFKLNGGFGISVGAVAGRGLTTAALAKVAKFTLQAEAFRDSGSPNPDGLRAPSVDLTMRSAGALLSQSLRRQADLSLLYAYYEPHERSLTFCNCSRWPPALLHNGAVSFLEERQSQIGQQWHRQYPPVQLALSPGDVFVAYTDGLPEARRGRGTLGVGPVRRVLQDHPGDSAGELIRHLLALPGGFCGDAQPANDAVVLVAKVGNKDKQPENHSHDTTSIY